MQSLKQIVFRKLIQSKLVKLLNKLSMPVSQFNLNRDLCNLSQKKVLICYFPLANYDFEKVSHSLGFHANQIVHFFLSKDYCIDIVGVHPDNASYEVIKNKEYDVVFGFGPLYIQYCQEHNPKLRIAFFTENNPIIVEQKYKERLDYFIARHPNVNYSCSSLRTEFYQKNIFEYSDAAIIMQDGFNYESFSNIYGEHLWKVNSNAIINKYFVAPKDINKEIVSSCRNNYLWFGSRGFIHKGLDILIDTFEFLPNCELHCYGIKSIERNLFKKLKKKNVTDCGTIDVRTPIFIHEVVQQHNFVILNSCSEGMSTAIATCMMHGIIPIISKECGFARADCIFELKDYTIESILEIIEITQNMTDEEILEKRHKCAQYALNNFSIESFDLKFSDAMNQCLTTFS